MKDQDQDSLFEMYIYESLQMIEQTESIVLDCENEMTFSSDAINNIFRNMHTLKGSSAMMQYTQIAETAHVIEDLFQLLREDPKTPYDFFTLSNLILQCVDYFKEEIQAISQNVTDHTLTETSHYIITAIKGMISAIKDESKELVEMTQHHHNIIDQIKPQDYQYEAKLFFTDDCEMENIRAFQVINHLEGVSQNYSYVPEDLLENEQSALYIKQEGFTVYFNTLLPYDEIHTYLSNTSYLKDLQLKELKLDSFSCEETSMNTQNKAVMNRAKEENDRLLDERKPLGGSSVVSVNVSKLDRLMDLVGELVIAETMVTNSKSTVKTDDESSTVHAFHQLRKITSELQDTIMSIRMVPLAPVFHRMRRVSRDMCKKLNKEIHIELIGEDTEIDKSIIDQLSDPLMHIVRNSIDHGIEDTQSRQKANKPEVGTVILSASNIGSEVVLTISDDGQGINKEKIIEKAKNNGLIQHEHEISDREAYQYIFHPGLSTKDQISEFSGRGVGMDVVSKSIEQIGGTIYVDSEPGRGTIITIKIPLTLAIIDGMNIRVQQSHYTLPTTSIIESFRPDKQQLIKDPDGNQMVMVRGECYSVVYLSEYLHKQQEYKHSEIGILVMVEHDDKYLCLAVDELVGQQQVVIKSLPAYLKQYQQMNKLTGCTLLGNGNISLILNMTELMSYSAINIRSSNY